MRVAQAPLPQPPLPPAKAQKDRLPHLHTFKSPELEGPESTGLKSRRTASRRGKASCAGLYVTLKTILNPTEKAGWCRFALPAARRLKLGVKLPPYPALTAALCCGAMLRLTVMRGLCCT
jgi:hypothetical protein